MKLLPKKMCIQLLEVLRVQMKDRYFMVTSSSKCQASKSYLRNTKQALLQKGCNGSVALDWTRIRSFELFGMDLFSWGSLSLFDVDLDLLRSLMMNDSVPVCLSSLKCKCKHGCGYEFDIKRKALICREVHCRIKHYTRRVTDRAWIPAEGIGLSVSYTPVRPDYPFPRSI